MNQIQLHLLPQNRGPFNCQPAKTVMLEPERILCNNIVMPWDFNPHSGRLYLLGNEYGPMGAVWADNESEAIDELIDQNLAAGILVDPDYYDREGDEGCYGGNASEPYDGDHLWIQEVRLDPAQDCRLICQFAIANAISADHLGNIYLPIYRNE